eukprot:1957940-Prymnesium_polylepis.1
MFLWKSCSADAHDDGDDLHCGRGPARAPPRRLAGRDHQGGRVRRICDRAQGRWRQVGPQHPVRQPDRAQSTDPRCGGSIPDSVAGRASSRPARAASRRLGGRDHQGGRERTERHRA